MGTLFVGIETYEGVLRQPKNKLGFGAGISVPGFDLFNVALGLYQSHNGC